MPRYNRYSAFCQHQTQRHQRRTLPLPTEALDFISNDYLNLGQHPQVIYAFQQAAAKGVGAGASRLLSPHLGSHITLEHQIARHKQSEAALIFNSGFQANQTVLSALLDPQVLGHAPQIFFHRSNHTSLYAGCNGHRLYRYRDLDHLQRLLHTHARPHCFIITESVFSMDGTQTDIEVVKQLSAPYDAFLYVDDAHGTGIVGPEGYGTLAQAQGIDCVMGTFGKALGGFGAYVACSQAWKEYLINRCTALIYTTALPPALIAAAQAAWGLLPQLTQERQRLHAMCVWLKKKLDLPDHSPTPIIPVILGSEEQTLDVAAALERQGFKVGAIRPPTVAPGTSRLRITLSTRHTWEQVRALAAAVGALL